MLTVTKKDEFCCVCAVVYFKGYAFLMCDCHQAVYCVLQTMCNSVDLRPLDLNTMIRDLCGKNLPVRPVAGWVVTNVKKDRCW